jgi:DNA helicase-2/ATP-dependent DNA helicase PcrA
LQDLAPKVQVLGKIMLTTYHSAKGREFHTVILPGLVNGLVPRDVNHRGRCQRATGRELQEQRRAFYVALSRAERQVYLITVPAITPSRAIGSTKDPATSSST